MNRTTSASEDPVPSQGSAGASCGQGKWVNILETGAVGDGSTVSTAGIQRAIDLCGQRGGGTVFIPAGNFVSGTIWMRSNTTLHLDAGAVLRAAGDAGEFSIWDTKWEANPAIAVHAPLIAAEGLANIALTGRGLIDGNGKIWWDAFGDGQEPDMRPNLVRFVDCRDVLIEGLRFTNSPRWTLNPVACDNVTITRVTIRNPHDSPNTDGINPDSCSNVKISNCHIDVGDDCIAIKSGTEDDGRPNPRPCQNITITNCTMLHGHGGVVIGSEMSGGVRNVAISNCVFCGTDRGIRLKSRRGRGNAVEDLVVDNIVMDEVHCPIVVNLFYQCGTSEQSKLLDPAPQPVNSGTPQFRRLRFSNITARKVKFAAAFILGLPEMFAEDIVLDGISIHMDRENREAGSPAMAACVAAMCRAGLVLTNARNVKLRRVDLYDQLGPAVTIDNSQDILVSDLCASADAGPLVRVDGIDSSTGEEEAAMDGGLTAGQDTRRVHTFTRGWRFSRRRSARSTAEAAISKLTIESPDRR